MSQEQKEYSVSDKLAIIERVKNGETKTHRPTCVCCSHGRGIRERTTRGWTSVKMSKIRLNSER